MIVKPPHVLIAEKKDEARLYEHLITLYRNNNMGVSMSEKKVKTLVHQMCNNLEGKICGFVDGENNEIAASVGVGFGSYWYSDDVYLNEIWLYVHPDYRGLGYHTDIKDFLIWYRSKMVNSETGKCLDLITSCTSNERLKGKIRWWSTWAKQKGGIFVVSDDNRNLH